MCHEKEKFGPKKNDVALNRLEFSYKDRHGKNIGGILP